MKTALFVLMLVNLLDFLVMPFLGAKSRSGAMLDKENTWLPFTGAYKFLVILELFLIGPLCSNGLDANSFGLIFMLVMPFLFDWMAMWGVLTGNGTYTLHDPLTSTLDDILRLKEHRFHPVHSFDPKFFVSGIVDNGFRYLASLSIAAAIIKILHFL